MHGNFQVVWHFVNDWSIQNQCDTSSLHKEIFIKKQRNAFPTVLYPDTGGTFFLMMDTPAALFQVFLLDIEDN